MLSSPSTVLVRTAFSENESDSVIDNEFPFTPGRIFVIVTVAPSDVAQTIPLLLLIASAMFLVVPLTCESYEKSFG